MKRSKPDTLDEASCRRTAVELLARREHSRLELVRKLAARGFPTDVITAALDALEHSGALAEGRFVESLIRSRVAKGQGPARIRAELAQRGVAETEVDRVLREADVDWFDTVRAVRRKRFGSEVPRDFGARARQARFLEYRGFSREHIRAALDGDAE